MTASRHLLRRDEGPAEHVRCDQDVENVLGLLAAGEIAHERNIRGEPWDRQRRELDYGVDLLVADPLRRHAAPGAAVAVQFPALDREPLLGAPRVAGDLMHGD